MSAELHVQLGERVGCSPGLSIRTACMHSSLSASCIFLSSFLTHLSFYSCFFDIFAFFDMSFMCPHTIFHLHAPSAVALLCISPSRLSEYVGLD